ncbi:cytosolic protein [Rossellomorea vietnamensis]|uniref:cytosolic protein n=1 Tax=Rossellomorea vietnamensis TaxID=218284 RepID=UPI001E2AC771|nr:cytosolic protein [Rossellomorea vietnamensis]MCC5801300.1 cytosolic protein [Rossellomorea vietnamensis]
MSGIRTLLKRFQSECETSDQHEDKELQSRYYKSMHQGAFNAVLGLFSSSEYEVISQSKDRGEITVRKNGMPQLFIVATVITVRPLETAVDFKVSADKGKIFGTYTVLKAQINHYYHQLDGELKKVK